MDNVRRLYASLLFAAGLAVVVASFPADVQANGRVTNFQKKLAGPYEVGLGTIPPSPSVGNLHLALTVTDPATKSPVLDAKVELQGTGPDSTEIEIGPTVATNSTLDPAYYEVNTSVGREGMWLFTTTNHRRRRRAFGGLSGGGQEFQPDYRHTDAGRARCLPYYLRAFHPRVTRRETQATKEAGRLIGISMSLPDTTRNSLAWKGVALALVFAALVLSRHDSASAHANLADADPAPNSVLDTPPSRITIWFTEPLEPSFSAIEVLDSRGSRLDNDDSAVDPRNPTVLYVTLQDDLPNGTYTVAWRNLSTVDGHTIRGTFFYSVGEPLSARASDLPSEPALQSPAEPFMRWAVLLGGLSVLGVLVLWLVVLRPPLASMSDAEDLVSRVRDRTDKIAIAGIVVALLGSIGHLLVQASSVHEVSILDTLGEPIRFVVTQTEWGTGWLRRTSLLIGALGPILALLRLRSAPFPTP